MTDRPVFSAPPDDPNCRLIPPDWLVEMRSDINRVYPDLGMIPPARLSRWARLRRRGRRLLDAARESTALAIAPWLDRDEDDW